ncbi:DUF1841 family protein [Chitinibacter tainanensis]|jgi:hypothetical protein|uniref:DUF1841 family protein n=1 Tax=Chitinibacter tainanensis TaxID=230667 RepID=UPI002355F21A|nr:DUF1841 family protein [Chitinibacter tainanensis]
MLFNPSRDQARRFFIHSWQKHQQGLHLEDLEAVVVDVLLAHPEYHAFLSEDYIDRDWPPEHGDTNPFLHLSLHLAIAEQLSIDQPAGVRALYQQLHAQHNDAHKALHDMLECLGEMIWQAQRNQSAPDPAIYLDGLRQRIKLIR